MIKLKVPSNYNQSSREGSFKGKSFVCRSVLCELPLFSLQAFKL